MTLREVLELGDPRLRAISLEVPENAFGTAELTQLVDDLIQTMRARNGAGIAAPQIGVSQRVFIIEVNNNPRYPYKPTIPLTVLVNPELRVIGEETISVIEGCLSVPNLRGRVERQARVEVRAYTPQGEPFTLIAEGLTAGTLQHELDHLNGLLFIDRIDDSSTLCSTASYNQFIAADFAGEAMRINTHYPKTLLSIKGHDPTISDPPSES